MRVLGIAALVTVAIGCGEPTAPDPLGRRVAAFVPDAAASLAIAEVSGTPIRDYVVVPDAPGWELTWSRLHAGKRPEPPRPAVDFDTYSALVAVWIGGGSRVQIDSVVRFDQGARMYVTRCWCGGTGGLQVEVSMAHVIRAPRWPIVDARTRTVATAEP